MFIRNVHRVFHKQAGCRRHTHTHALACKQRCEQACEQVHRMRTRTHTHMQARSLTHTHTHTHMRARTHTHTHNEKGLGPHRLCSLAAAESCCALQLVDLQAVELVPLLLILRHHTLCKRVEGHPDGIVDCPSCTACCLWRHARSKWTRLG